MTSEMSAASTTGETGPAAGAAAAGAARFSFGCRRATGFAVEVVDGTGAGAGAGAGVALVRGAATAGRLLLQPGGRTFADETGSREERERPALACDQGRRCGGRTLASTG